MAAATSLNAAALFCLQVSLPTWWTVVAEISGKHGAAMFGLMNGLGGLGVMAMNFFVGRIVEARAGGRLFTGRVLAAGVRWRGAGLGPGGRVLAVGGCDAVDC